AQELEDADGVAPLAAGDAQRAADLDRAGVHRHRARAGAGDVELDAVIGIHRVQVSQGDQAAVHREGARALVTDGEGIVGGIAVGRGDVQASTVHHQVAAVAETETDVQQGHLQRISHADDGGATVVDVGVVGGDRNGAAQPTGPGGEIAAGDVEIVGPGA